MREGIKELDCRADNSDHHPVGPKDSHDSQPGFYPFVACCSSQAFNQES